MTRSTLTQTVLSVVGVAAIVAGTWGVQELMSAPDGTYDYSTPDEPSTRQVSPTPTPTMSSVPSDARTEDLPPFVPEEGQFSLFPLIEKPSVRAGSSGEEVRYLQGVLRFRGNRPEVEVDGRFGPKTDAAVRDFQRFLGLPDDGEVRSDTWAAIDLLATSQ